MIKKFDEYLNEGNEELRGKRIRLISMKDDPDPIEEGEEGTIKGVDGIGQIMVKWDNGRTLSLIPDVDEYEILDDEEELSERYVPAPTEEDEDDYEEEESDYEEEEDDLDESMNEGALGTAAASLGMRGKNTSHRSNVSGGTGDKNEWKKSVDPKRWYDEPFDDMTQDNKIKYLVKNFGMSKKEATEICPEGTKVKDLPSEIKSYFDDDLNEERVIDLEKLIGDNYYYDDQQLEVASRIWDNADIKERMHWLSLLGYESADPDVIRNKGFEDFADKVKNKLAQLFFETLGLTEGAETVPMAGSGTHVGFGDSSGKFTKSAGQAVYGGDSPSAFAGNSNTTKDGSDTETVFRAKPRFKDIKKKKEMKDKKNRLNNQIGADIDALSKPGKKVTKENLISFEEFNRLNEDGEGGGTTGGGGGTAVATLGNTGGMGAIVSAQPSSIPGDIAGSTKGSGDIGRPLGTFTKQPAGVFPKQKKKKKKDKESTLNNQRGANIDKFYSTNYRESISDNGKIIQSWKSFGDTK